MVSLNTNTSDVSVDAAGKVWAGCYGSHNVMRIDPEAGDEVVIAGVTNHVGVVDLVVDLGDGSGHPAPYNVAAQPYNYSDMTGFNNRIVNPGGQPLKGYWAVVDDCGIAGEWWRQVTWTDNLPLSGCAVEVQVRAGEDREELVNETFVPVANGATIAGVKGRFIEVRVALVRDDTSKQPVLYDLTLHGESSGFVGDFMDVLWEPFETEDAWFFTDVTGAEPVTYEWYVMPPWTNQWALVPGVSGPDLILTNVDLWDDGTLVRLSVSNGAGETLSLGPTVLRVWPLPINIPTFGSASRYPATVHVRGQSNNFSRVEVTLKDLTHDYPADLDILLVSPSGTEIMLMSDAGGWTTVSNATLVFHPLWQGSNPFPPEQGPIPSNTTTHYRPYDYGEQEMHLETQPPYVAPEGPYTGFLDQLPDSDPNPNGIWKLYIYDDKVGQTGVLQDSWSLQFFYE